MAYWLTLRNAGRKIVGSNPVRTKQPGAGQVKWQTRLCVVLSLSSGTVALVALSAGAG